MSLDKPIISKNRATKNRAIRQEALREQLASQKHVEQVIGTIKKLEDEDREIDANMVYRLSKAIEARMKLINKYLPDLKSTEITGSVQHDHRQITERDLAVIHEVRRSLNADG